MIGKDDSIFPALFVVQIRVRIRSAIENMVLVSRNIRIRNVGKVDTLRTAHRARQAYEWAADKMPTKKIKSHKRKERQAGKKDIQKALKD